MQNGVGCISGMEFRRGNFSGGEEGERRFLSLSLLSTRIARVRGGEKRERKGEGRKKRASTASSVPP